MRTLLCAAAVAAATIALPAAAAPKAASVEAYGIKATYQGPALNVGYSARARRMTACLASYPGAYNPRTDLVVVRPGVSRRCALQG